MYAAASPTQAAVFDVALLRIADDGSDLDIPCIEARHVGVPLHSTRRVMKSTTLSLMEFNVESSFGCAVVSRDGLPQLHLETHFIFETLLHVFVESGPNRVTIRAPPHAVDILLGFITDARRQIVMTCHIDNDTRWPPDTFLMYDDVVTAVEARAVVDLSPLLRPGKDAVFSIVNNSTSRYALRVGAGVTVDEQQKLAITLANNDAKRTVDNVKMVAALPLFELGWRGEEWYDYFSASDATTGKLIKFPGRGETCTHFAPYDVVQLASRMADSGWCGCPVCHRPVHVSSLYIDLYLLGLLHFVRAFFLQHPRSRTEAWIAVTHDRRKAAVVDPTTRCKVVEFAHAPGEGKSGSWVVRA